MVLLNVYLNWFVIKKADTKVILCTKLAAARGVSTACISTVNSDIAIYAMYFAMQISIPMYNKIGISDRRRCVDQGLIQKEKVHIDCERGAQINIFTNKTATQ